MILVKSHQKQREEKGTELENILSNAKRHLELTRHGVGSGGGNLIITKSQMANTHCVKIEESPRVRVAVGWTIEARRCHIRCPRDGRLLDESLGELSHSCSGCHLSVRVRAEAGH